MDKTIQVVAALIERDGTLLAAQRPGIGPHDGRWEFPGGKIESGETPEACLIREIREELAIEIEVLGFFASTRHREAGRTIELLAYRAAWRFGALELREHDAVQWVEPARFHEIRWSPPDVAIAEAYQARSGQG